MREEHQDSVESAQDNKNMCSSCDAHSLNKSSAGIQGSNYDTDAVDDVSGQGTDTDQNIDAAVSADATASTDAAASADTAVSADTAMSADTAVNGATHIDPIDTTYVDNSAGRADGLPPIIAHTSISNFEAYGQFKSIDEKPFSVRFMRHAVVKSYDIFSATMVDIAKRLHWFPRVEPYIGYGTGEYSRLICRTLYAPAQRGAGMLTRGIRTAFMTPAAGTRVRMSIDGTPLRTVQVGDSETFELFDENQMRPCDYALSDESGYLDIVAKRELEPGKHDVAYEVEGRPPVHSTLYTIARNAKVGIISDVDDTILVTQVPVFWRAAYNTLLRNPRTRTSVPSMSVLYSKLHEMFPDAPFFYLSTSPWNIESSIRHFIEYHGFPSGPLLLRDLDPRPTSFVPSGVEHKLEFIEQLMADFPDMQFILLGDDGQRDPTTYATITRRHPGRVIAIGIRQLRPGEGGNQLQKLTGLTITQPAPPAGVPVFYGTTGLNLIHTMLPYLRNVFKR